MPAPQEGRRIREEHAGGRGFGKLKVFPWESHAEWSPGPGLARALETDSAMTCCVFSDSHLGTSLGLSFPFLLKKRFALQGP